MNGRLLRESDDQQVVLPAWRFPTAGGFGTRELVGREPRTGKLVRVVRLRAYRLPCDHVAHSGDDVEGSCFPCRLISAAQPTAAMEQELSEEELYWAAAVCKRPICHHYCAVPGCGLLCCRWHAVLAPDDRWYCILHAQPASEQIELAASVAKHGRLGASVRGFLRSMFVNDGTKQIQLRPKR